MLKVLRQIKNIIKARELLLQLVLKDLKIRYRHPLLGFLWAIIVPLFMIIIFKLIFSLIIKIQIENYPFFIYLMTAVFPWNYFNMSVSMATNSIIDNGNLIKKTYFPREIIPISVVISNLINFLLTIIVMLLFLVFYKMKFTTSLILLPAVIFMQILISIGVALIVSSLQVVFRDVKYIVEILLIAWFYLVPGFYPLSLVADISKTFLRIYLLNPFVGLISLYRIALLNGYAKSLPSEVNILNLVLWPIVACVAIFFIGFVVFRKYEPGFADLI